MIKQYYNVARLVAHISLGLILLVLTGALWNNNSRVVLTTKRWWHQRAIRILGFRVELATPPPKQDSNQGLLFISNHVSWTDIPLIGSLVSINFLSKAEVKDWPLIGTLAAGVGTLFVKRGHGESGRIAREIADYLEGGRSILFFPEGTTTNGDQLKAFHSKLFKAADHTSVRLCPVAVHYSVEGRTDNPVAFIDDDEFTAHIWKLFGLRAITARVEFLPCRDIYTDDIEAMAESLRDEIQTAIDRHKLRATTNTNTLSPGASNPGDSTDEATSF